MPKLFKYQNDMRKNDHVQSVLIKKDLYGLDIVPQLIKVLGYNCFYIDETANYYRVRQFNPRLKKRSPSYKIVKDKNLPGVEYVIEF